jgi:hypothetical protein
MRKSWSDPYHVVIEVENERCKVLTMMEDVGIRQFKVIDMRGSSTGSIRHLVELPLDQVNKILKEKLIRRQENTEAEGKSTIWVESEGCDVCNTMLSLSLIMNLLIDNYYAINAACTINIAAP